MLLLFLFPSLLLLLLSPVSPLRTYPNKCETCIEMVSYMLRDSIDWIEEQGLTRDMMQAFEVYCFHHVGGTEAICSDFTNMIRKGDLFKTFWKATAKCRQRMVEIAHPLKSFNLQWGCPSAPDCICLNLQQCDSMKQLTLRRSHHAECSNLDENALEEFVDIFKRIDYTAFDSDIL